MRHTAHRAMATALLVTLALTGCANRSETCRKDGGQVVLDGTKYETKGGKLKVTREYECIKGDKELYEWKVTSSS